MKNKLLIGVGEMFEGAVDPSVTPEQVSYLTAAMGFGTMRVWTHHSDLLYLGKNGEPCLNDDKVALYKKQLKTLIDGGVRHLVGMNHCYLYPEGFVASAFNVVPLPESEYYKPFLEIQTKSCKLLAETFGEILYWEIGNEINADRFLAKPGFPSSGLAEGAGGAELNFTLDEKAQITVDICKYSVLGVKQGNRKAKSVLPSPAGDGATVAAFVDKMYGLMGGRYRDYFDILSCHPYNFDGQFDRLIAYCNLIKKVADNRGDKNLEMYLTEYGYYDDDLMKFGLSRSESDIRQAAYLVGDMEAIKQKLPYVTAIHIFRLLDWHTGPGMEMTFGLFASPDTDTGIIPKAKGLALYKYINGADADIRKLYKYAKINVQGDKEYLGLPS